MAWVWVRALGCELPPFSINILVILHGPAQVSVLPRSLPGFLQPTLTSSSLNSHCIDDSGHYSVFGHRGLPP